MGGETYRVCESPASRPHQTSNPSKQSYKANLNHHFLQKETFTKKERQNKRPFRNQGFAQQRRTLQKQRSFQKAKVHLQNHKIFQKKNFSFEDEQPFTDRCFKSKTEDTGGPDIPSEAADLSNHELPSPRTGRKP